MLGGYLGVTVFFVLSGYLITGLLTVERENRGRVELGTFYAGRAARLYPALLVVVIVALVVSQITGHQAVTNGRMLEDAGGSLLYINDFLLAFAYVTKWST